jgi:thiamine phosphate synthase YjbQ (UPF0047 family)
MSLKNYKTKKLLEDLFVEGMTLEEFFEHGDKDYRDGSAHVRTKLVGNQALYVEDPVGRRGQLS